MAKRSEQANAAKLGGTLKPGTKHELAMLPDGENLYLLLDGVKIAKRGLPGTQQARTWVPFDPAFTVIDLDGGAAIEVLYNGQPIVH